MAEAEEDGEENIKIQIDTNMLNLTEYIELESQGELKDREREWIDNGGEEEDSDEEFDFVKNCDMGNSYFTLSNESRRTFKRGT